ncbi:hypothetical protein [Bradyrhizobium lablabi]|uniref:hypothetical protein n=1 Tax=Bradyrhizobium lablabi TaxID=722472 RepID=UPI001BAAE0F0|nr:hypothetical protein [Bradyrhizobium lablabi]MBR0693674.1 hypothetical protein [Bradyrhizobium lablabi]
MRHHLIVVHEFGQYAKGDKIIASDEVAKVLDSPQHTHVVKIAAPDEPPALPADEDE